MALHLLAHEWIIFRRVRKCSTCDQRRRFVERRPTNPWFDSIMVCLGCGDSWSGGFLMPRPFRPAWRAEEITTAKRDWASAPPVEEADARWAAILEFEFAD